jgi:hypothetical protein
MKFIVLSFKNKVRQKSVRNGIRRSPGSIFHEFVVVLEGLAVILDLLGASVLEVDFWEDFEGYPGGAQIESTTPVGGNGFIPGSTKQLPITDCWPANS